MTRLQQVLFSLETQYLGHPYFVTGHALYTALARRVDDHTRRHLTVSHGVFVPGEYGAYPPAHSQSGYGGKLGQSLPPVETYDDLFVFRDPAQRWLLDSRPRDAHNTHPLHQHGDRRAMATTCWFGRPPGQRKRRRSMDWYLHCYLQTQDTPATPTDDLLPLAEATLDGLQVGGARNYGFGELSVVDTQCVDLDALEYTRLREAQPGAFRLELVTPYVLTTTYPDADDQSVPWWWGQPPGTATDEPQPLRRRATRLVEGADEHRLTTIDHGQVVRYTGDRPVETARNGIQRVGTHARFGFGELRVRPAQDDRVPERAATEGAECH